MRQPRPASRWRRATLEVSLKSFFRVPGTEPRQVVARIIDLWRPLLRRSEQVVMVTIDRSPSALTSGRLLLLRGQNEDRRPDRSTEREVPHRIDARRGKRAWRSES